jgi:hypothetical protein
MKTDELIRLLVASGAVKVTPGGKVTVEPSKMAGHWVDRGRGWQREGGGADEQDTGQDSRD